jgi:hypothetical protein
MSAYVLGDENFDAIIAACKRCFGSNLFVLGKTFNLDSEEECSQIGQILKDQNYASVNARYKEKTEIDPYKYKASSELYSPVQILKICDCYDYQACETGDYRESLACDIVDTLRLKLITLLPGYDDAKWGI